MAPASSFTLCSPGQALPTRRQCHRSLTAAYPNEDKTAYGYRYNQPVYIHVLDKVY